MQVLGHSKAQTEEFGWTLAEMDTLILTTLCFPLDLFTNLSNKY